VLASLDADTRQYLELLINSGGQGLKGRGYQLAQVLEKFKPTHQDLARVSEAVAVRRTNLRRLVNSLARLNTALAAKQVQIGQLIDASSVVFHAFAAEDRNVSRAVADLPATLRQTTSTLEKVQSFATILGPAARNLIPAANQLPATNAALVAVARPSTPILRDQIRPFVVQARPLVRNLRPAAVNLAKATPGLTKTFAVFNRLLNMVGFNPGNTEHGYLFWLAWLDHNARTLFSVQDANGDFRPLFLQASCATLAQTVNTTPAQAAIQNLVPILSDANLCPTQAAAIAKNADSPKGALRPNAAVTTRIPKLPTGLPGTLFPNHRG
jgi:phospholipid/cholesterol/gamma-HCH transport system substrate-binding protein